MKKLLLISLIGLAACTTVPVKQEFPEAPAELMKSCPPLETIDTPEVVLSDLMKKVAKNYGYRHDCDAQNESWKAWYQKQKKIFNDANR